METFRAVKVNCGTRGNKVFRELCKVENCEHIKYALNLSKVQRALERKGWIIEEGKIIRKSD